MLPIRCSQPPCQNMLVKSGRNRIGSSGAPGQDTNRRGIKP